MLTDYPYLEQEDITQALRYAAWRSEEREVVFERRMNILIDMNLSPRWLKFLMEAGLGRLV